jgi:hypothetical protein
MMNLKEYSDLEKIIGIVKSAQFSPVLLERSKTFEDHSENQNLGRIHVFEAKYHPRKLQGQNDFIRENLYHVLGDLPVLRVLK